jgi:adenosylhomocysteine nucleosidase
VKVLAVAAMTLELKPWLGRCGAVEKLPWPLAFARSAQWNDAALYAVANGPGPGLASEALRVAMEKAGPFDLLISVGLCGALDTELPLDSICTADAVGDGESAWPANPIAGAQVRRLLSIDRFLGDPAEKQKWAGRGFGIVEMEAASIARFAAENRVAFCAAKVVSDRADESFAIDFNEYRDASGRFSNTRIALAAAAHPVRYGPDLYRMASRGPAASEILGEFLAKSRF